MAVRVVCRACGKRLKLPDGTEHRRSAKCPKCLAPVDLTAARAASVYLPAPARHEATAKTTGGLRPPLAQEPNNAPAGSSPPLPWTKEPLSLDDAPLSLDDDPAPDAGPPEPGPFRVPVYVFADSLRQVVGPCFAVFVPHGLFLEVEPLKPFLYVPVGSAVDAPAPGELGITLPDGRAVALRVEARYSRPLAADARAFLAGDRPAPVAADYRRKWWLLWPALIFAAGLTGGPLVLARSAGFESGLALGAAFALAGLCANAAVVLFSRRSVPGQVAVMAVLCGAVTGLFLFGATAYLAGRKKGVEQAQAQNPAPPPIIEPPVAPAPESPGVEPPVPRNPPSHVDRAYANGASALDDGPADVTALVIAPDGNHLGIGYADGTTRVWPLDQPTFESALVGPKATAAVTRVQFDSSSRFLFATSLGDVIAAPRNGAPPSPAKIPGTVVAVAPDLTGDRVRFAAVRGNLLQHRFLSTAFVVNPPKATGFAVPTKKDEVIPAANGPDPAKPSGPTFLAWTPSGRLFAGTPDGGILAWSILMKPEPVNRDHKAAVRAWAACDGTGDFATGDDKGAVAVWPYKGGKPTAGPVFTVPVAGLSFSPSGMLLAATDNTGWLAIVDAATLKVLQRRKLPAPVKALAFGPNDDAIILANGKAVEVWWVPELMK